MGQTRRDKDNMTEADPNVNERNFDNYVLEWKPKVNSKYAKSVYHREVVRMEKMISRSDVDRFESVGNKAKKGPYDLTDKRYEFDQDKFLPKLSQKIELDKQV